MYYLKSNIFVFTKFISIILLTIIMSACSKSVEPQNDPDQVAYDNANHKNGGIMYDKFWAIESNFDQNSANLATISSKSDFFRCKQCHGWDGLGNTGAYISRGPKTSRPNISALNLYQIAQSKTSKELFDAMKATNGRRDISYDLSTYNPETNSTEGDKMPNLNQLLTDAQIWDIVKFLKEGMFDVSKLYDGTATGTYPTGKYAFSNVGKDGNATNGKTFFTANCSPCHGTDGSTIELEGRTVGQFVREKSNEAQHKVKYGQLGSAMTGNFELTLSQAKDLYKALADTTSFPNL